MWGGVFSTDFSHPDRPPLTAHMGGDALFGCSSCRPPRPHGPTQRGNFPCSSFYYVACFFCPVRNVPSTKAKGQFTRQNRSHEKKSTRGDVSSKRRQISRLPSKLITSGLTGARYKYVYRKYTRPKYYRTAESSKWASQRTMEKNKSEEFRQDKQDAGRGKLLHP